MSYVLSTQTNAGSCFVSGLSGVMQVKRERVLSSLVAGS